MLNRKLLQSLTFVFAFFAIPITAFAQYQVYSDQNYPSINYAEGRSFDRYVDAQNGSDSNDGKTWATAWKTIKHGVDEMADNGNGRWLHLRGQFVPPAKVSLNGHPSRGTASAPMVIVADPVQGAQIDAATFTLDLSGQHYWLIDGRNRLSVTNAGVFVTANGWENGDTSNITVRNISGTMTQQGGAGNVGFIAFDGINYVGAFNNHITGPGWASEGINANTADIYMTKCPKMRIENNWLSKAPRPIYLKHDQPSTVTKADTEIVIKNNFIPFFSTSVYAGSEVNVASKWALIENNVFGVRLDIGVEGGNNSPDGGSYNKIYQNTLRSLSYTVADTIPQYNDLKNNVVLESGKVIFAYHPDIKSYNTSDYNLQEGGVRYGDTNYSVAQFSSLTGQDAHSLEKTVSFSGGSDTGSLIAPDDLKIIGGNAQGQYLFSDGTPAGADISTVGVFPVSGVNPPSAPVAITVN